jgi:hypothetical protein
LNPISAEVVSLVQRVAAPRAYGVQPDSVHRPSEAARFFQRRALVIDVGSFRLEIVQDNKYMPWIGGRNAH